MVARQTCHVPRASGLSPGQRMRGRHRPASGSRVVNSWAWRMGCRLFAAAKAPRYPPRRAARVAPALAQPAGRGASPARAFRAAHRGQAANQRGRARATDGAVRSTRSTGLHPVGRLRPPGQRHRIHGQGGATVAGQSERQDAIHRAREPADLRSAGRTATSSRSTTSCATSCWTRRSLARSSRRRCRCPAGGSTTREKPLASQVRPHSSLGYRPPAPEARQPWAPGFAPLSPPPRAA